MGSVFGAIIFMTVLGLVLYWNNSNEKKNAIDLRKEKELQDNARLANLASLPASTVPNAAQVYIPPGSICKNCGSLNEFSLSRKKNGSGPSILLTLILLVVFFPLAIIYLLVSMSSKKTVVVGVHCRACGDRNSVLPTNTPEGERLCRQFGWYSRK